MEFEALLLTEAPEILLTMCLRACGCWPQSDTYLEPGPPQDTYIIVDDNAQFYPDPVRRLSYSLLPLTVGE